MHPVFKLSLSKIRGRIIPSLPAKYRVKFNEELRAPATISSRKEISISLKDPMLCRLCYIKIKTHTVETLHRQAL